MTLPNTLTPRVAELLRKMESSRGRLVFGIDATGSRESTWDLSTSLTTSMFEEAAKVGGLDLQLVYFGGESFAPSEWTTNAHELMAQMRRVRCEAGQTQIERTLKHLRREHELKKINAAIFIGDACEEAPRRLYNAATNLGVPLFLFQEGNGTVADLDYLVERYGGDGQPPIKVEAVFRQLAKITNGAYGKFDGGAAKQLGELLRAVVAFACGGIPALAGQHTDSARLLLSQMK